jgi:two-component system sensor histidine kinase TctE
MANTLPKPSLRKRLVRQVLTPLALTWLLGTSMTVGVSYFYAAKAFDRALLDDAMAMASRVGLGAQGLTLELSNQEMGSALFDQSERVYFSVRRLDGSLLAGHGSIKAALPQSPAKVLFSEVIHEGQWLRAVSVLQEQPLGFSVVMAQTKGSRQALLEKVVSLSVAPQLILLVLMALWLRHIIGLELKPLDDFQHTIDRRDARDLRPLLVQTQNTNIERLGVAINNLLDRLGHSMRAQREFSGNVAHELRTPLAGIRASAEYALSHPDPAVWREQLQRIASSELRADRLVEQLLALALAEETDTGVPLELVDVDAVVRDTVLRYLPRADAAGVDLGVQGIDQPVQWVANLALMEGALSNLLDNALRYGHAPQGSSRVTVSVSVLASVSASVAGPDTQNQTLEVSVTDNGPGLSLQERQHLMQRGVRGLHAERLGQGAGLGLAIVSKFAQVMHARFELSPGPEGQGLCATLSFKRDPRAS